MPRIYTHPVEPQDYPAFHSRFAQAVLRKDLENKIGFTCLRSFTLENGRLVDFKRDLDLYTKEFELGSIIWPVYPTLFAENFEQLVAEIAARGLWLYDFWGYVPGSQADAKTIWGEYTPPVSALSCLKEKLGSHFLGFDNGEQDGRYLGYAAQLCPAPHNRTTQYARFQAHFEKMGDDLDHHLSVLASLTFLHPFAKEGNTVILGAETGQALPCANMWYSFIRGAGKQYGLLWCGNASIFNRWGYKCYESESDGPGYEHGPEAGTSLSLLRRLLFVEYMYNADILGFEQSWIIEDNVEKRITAEKTLYQTAEKVHLSPVGLIQQQMVRFVKEQGRPGVMQTPVTVFTDFFSGWVPARQLYTKTLYQVWGNTAYAMGDHQLHALFDMMYPGYEDAGFFRSERGFLTPTPYGDILDVTCSDAPAEVLMQYNAALVFGEGPFDYEAFWKLRRFAEQGGHLVIGIEKLFNTEWDNTPYLSCFGIDELGKTSAANGDVLYDGQLISSTSFELTEVKPAAAATLIATADGKPYLLTVPCKAGKITLICSPFGLEKNPHFDPSAKNVINQSVEPPYRFQPAVKTFLAGLFSGELLFKINNPLLQFITNCRDAQNYQMLVVNNTHTAQHFDITDGLLKADIIERVDLPVIPAEERGWLPKSEWLAVPPLTGSGRYEVNAGDYALFNIQSGTAAQIKPPALPSAPNRKLFLTINTPTIKEFLLAHPSFSHYFGGVKFPAAALERLEEEALRREAAWVRRQGIDVMIDFTDLINHYPNISLLYNVPGRTENGLAQIASILRKAALFGTDKAIFSLQRNAEVSLTLQQAEENLICALNLIRKEAASQNITVYLQNSRSLAGSNSFSGFEDTCRIAWGAGFKTAMNAGHSLALEDKSPLFTPDGILLNAPQRDDFGQMTDAHLPLRGSLYESELLSLAKKTCEFICLDSAYTNWSETMMDIEILTEKQ